MDSCAFYNRLPYSDLQVMTVQQIKDREWDERRARVELPKVRQKLREEKAESKRLQKELDDRRMQDTLQVSQVVELQNDEPAISPKEAPK